jgi:RimJ/RimL family protein N-acetyltransferase
MLSFERTHDMDLVKRIMSHRKVYPHVSDDGCPAREEFVPIAHPAIWYVSVLDDGGVIGLFVFSPQNTVCWEVHTCLLPTAWGGRATEAARGVIEWIWANTPCRRIVTTVPANNRLALHLAERAGLEQFGVNAESWLKKGKLHGQILLGISREKTQQCQQH